MIRPTITDIKELICGLGGYRTDFGVSPYSDLKVRMGDVKVEFDTGRKGVDFWKGDWHGPNQDRFYLHFRLAENWFESVLTNNLATYGRRFVLSATKCRPPGGMDAAWKLLYADQTFYRNFCRPAVAYAVEFMGKVEKGYPMKAVANKLREPYHQALGLETRDQ